MRAQRLLMNRFERAAALGMRFVAQQRLRTGGDVRQRIVDLVAGAVGQLFQRVELCRSSSFIQSGMTCERSSVRDSTSPIRLQRCNLDSSVATLG